MSESDQEEAKRALHKLLKEFESNRGMAQMVTGKPVALMPTEEQDRLFRGFCTPQNLQVLRDSQSKLAAAKSLKLEPEEERKIDVALDTLEQLTEALADQIGGRASQSQFREKVQELLQQPLPSSEEELVGSLATQLESLFFLASQPLHEKDNWDKMIDCVQMHDALSRTRTICNVLQSDGFSASPVPRRGEATEETCKLCEESIEELENFFAGERGDVPECFSRIQEGLTQIWGDNFAAVNDRSGEA